MKKIVLLFSIVVVSFSLKAQDVVKWNFTAKKIADKTYELHLTPIVQNPWHIYSQLSPEGGALPTTIRFNKNPLISIEGKTKEVGKVKSKYEEVFEVTVKYFEGQADFVQIVKIKAGVKTNIGGSIEFMACKEGQCLPPQSVQFSVKLE